MWMILRSYLPLLSLCIISFARIAAKRNTITALSEEEPRNTWPINEINVKVSLDSGYQAETIANNNTTIQSSTKEAETFFLFFQFTQTCMPPGKNNILVFYQYMGLILAPLNIILNGICMRIFMHPTWRQSPMGSLLKGLTVFEILFASSLLGHFCAFDDESDENFETTSKISSWSDVINSSNEDTHLRNRLYRAMAQYFWTRIFAIMVCIFQVGRNWTVVLLAAYRYDAVCRPISGGLIFARQRILPMLVATLIISCIVSAPRLFEQGLIICLSTGISSNYFLILLKYSLYRFIYIGMVTFAVQSGGPVICVCVLSFFVIRQISKRRKYRSEKEKRSAVTFIRERTINSSSILEEGISIDQNEDKTPNETEVKNGISESYSGIRKSQDDRPKVSINVEEGETGNFGKQSRIFDGCTNIASKPKKTIFPRSCSVEKTKPSGDKLVLTLSITFFVLETPAFFSKILERHLNSEPSMILGIVANLLIYLDSTLNVFVYMGSNPTFRKVALEVISTHYKKTKSALLACIRWTGLGASTKAHHSHKKSGVFCFGCGGRYDHKEDHQNRLLSQDIEQLKAYSPSARGASLSCEDKMGSCGPNVDTQCLPFDQRTIPTLTDIIEVESSESNPQISNPVTTPAPHTLSSSIASHGLARNVESEGLWLKARRERRHKKAVIMEASVAINRKKGDE